MKRYFIFLLGAILCFAAGCAGADSTAGSSEPEQETTTEPAPEPAPEYRTDVPVPDTITGKIEMEDGGVMTFELYPDLAPESVKNFVFLARQGFYNGTKFHRIISGMMIQGGCPLGIGSGNPGYSIFGEFGANGHENDLLHTRGVLSMARAQDYNSAGSQFFIMHDVYPSLDNLYAAFGMITSGMDVVDRIAETPNDGGNGSVAAADMPVIKSISIDGDFAMDEPNKLPR